MTCDKCKVELYDLVECEMRVHLCPLHEAAGDLLAACETVMRMAEEFDGTYVGTDGTLATMFKAAIEKARRTA